MKRVGRYELLGEIATGGMAEIFLAREAEGPDAGAQRVVKRILPHLARQTEFVEMFLHEAKLLARIRHPNVVVVRDLIATDDGLYLVMDLVEGWSVTAILRVLEVADQRVDPAAAAWIAAEAAAGLHAAHELQDDTGRSLGVVHRDVSPHNIMVGPDGAVTLLDFGIAKAADRASHTATGDVKGKVEYMSPEQCRGEALDRRTDIFSLGVVLYELSTSRRLFKRNGALAAMRAVCKEPFPFPSELIPGYPEPLERVVMRALARRKEDRFATAGELRAALLDVDTSLCGAGPAARERTAALLGGLLSRHDTGSARPSPPVRRSGPHASASVKIDGGPTAGAATGAPAVPNLGATLLPEPGATFRLAPLQGPRTKDLPRAGRASDLQGAAQPESARAPRPSAPAPLPPAGPASLHETLRPEPPPSGRHPRLAHAPAALDATLGHERQASSRPGGISDPVRLEALSESPPTELSMLPSSVARLEPAAQDTARPRAVTAVAVAAALAAAALLLLGLPARDAPGVATSSLGDARDSGARDSGAGDSGPRDPGERDASGRAVPPEVGADGARLASPEAGSNERRAPEASDTSAKSPHVILDIESEPAGALVVVAGISRGKTPLRLELPRGEGPVELVLVREGFGRIVRPVIPDADQRLVVALAGPARAPAPPRKVKAPGRKPRIEWERFPPAPP